MSFNCCHYFSTNIIILEFVGTDGAFDLAIILISSQVSLIICADKRRQPLISYFSSSVFEITISPCKSFFTIVCDVICPGSRDFREPFNCSNIDKSVGAFN